MRIVLLVTDHLRGGTPLRFARLARGLAHMGDEVLAACLAPAGPLTEQLVREGVRTFCAGASGPRDVAALRRLKRAIVQFQPEVIHSALFHANVAARVVGWGTGIPVVTTTATLERERKWHLVVEQLTAGWDCGQIVNSQALATHVHEVFGVPHEKIYTVPASVRAIPTADPAASRQRLGVRADQFVVLWAGRMDPVKRVEVALAAAALLRGQGYRFFFAGDGPLRARFQSAVEMMELHEEVCFTGWCAALADLLAAADAFLMPSLTEGMPNAMLEAMAAGVPVVASDIPVAREVAGPAPGRIVVVPEARAALFANELVALRRDPQQARQMAQRARAWVHESCSEHAAVQQTRAVYERVVSQQRGRRM